MDVVLGLGANLGEPAATFRKALERLAASHRVVTASGLYRTVAVGPPQPEFLNMAVLVAARVGLLRLLDECQELEARAGRDRSRETRWGPRVLDLDLLLADGLVHLGGRLTLPHPELHRRAFALVPAAELVPGWVHPFIGRKLADLADEAVTENPEAVTAAGTLTAEF